MLGIAHHPFTGFKSYPPDLGNFQFGSKAMVHADTPPRVTASADLFSKVNQVLSYRLSETLGARSPVPVTAAENLFDPEAVANNVLSFVQNRLQQAGMNGASADELASLLDKAKSAIEQGMEEARGALEGMGLLSDSVKAGIEQAKEMIFKGLEVNEEADLTVHGARLIEATQRFLQVEKSAFELQVQTSDGDLVTLKFSQHNREQGALSFRQTASTSELNSRYAASSHTRLSLSIEGNLDEGELSAISDLAQNIQQASESFFDGNLQAAFEQGMNLGYNSDEIAGFSLEMSHSLTSVATTKYREISQLDASQTPNISGLEHVGDLLGRLSHIVDQAKSLLEDGQRATADMLKGFFSQHPESASLSDLLSQSGEENIKDVADNLVERASHRGHDVTPGKIQTGPRGAESRRMPG